ncbi:tannase/feruloyl esterase family alpha/beta hydrolase [Shewanella avicenniae]|uniref:Tannase/feruloyl esterase family alpha/beta hydrolase n=1 Tax=Shewanella avicenniae TaxID=2814294 RepID=A0ABX7QPV1_9GAMM|nr:tannase/feruloyl esterase family alpha/beta hydrolase [Shewanella avicenniae]QSX33304.1 tannase/feruloyl esterase family alpha/beta hydrolase [Shewanella avicenniae]
MSKSINTSATLKGLSAVSLLAMLGVSGQALASEDVQTSCEQLMNVAITNGQITEAHMVAPGDSSKDPFRMFTGSSNKTFKLPEHCLVRGDIEKRIGADGKTYRTQFEVRLPTKWSKRFMFQGGGGTDGFLANALGTIPSSGSTALPALARGYAVASMNGGHDSPDPTFGLDQQARIDYAYAALGKVTHAAKAIISTYYNAEPAHSYFMGCSNGGREAMMAAQRYPLEFNGVVAGNPGFHLSRASVAEAWDTQALMSVAPDAKQGGKVLANALTQQDLDLVSNTILQQCDSLDGVKDGIVANYMACKFTPDTLRCSNKKDGQCLADAKVDALQKVFNGAVDSQGNKLYNSWPYDTGVNAPGWRAWKLGTSQDPAKPNALNTHLGAGSMAFYFLTPANPSFNPMTFNFDTDTALTNETGAINDATSTYLNSYVAKGGKMIVFQGVSDPVFSADDIRDWYVKAQQNTAKNSDKDWARLFMVPGMNHCGGGPALDDFDPLTAIQNWVEKDDAPNALKAQGKAFPGKSMPICAYPQTAQYNGSGDVNAFDSYTCK